MTDKGIDFEDKVREIVEDYGAPEGLEDEIIDFLLGSGNVYSIIEVYEETEENKK